MLRRPIIYGMMLDLVLNFPATEDMTNWIKACFILEYKYGQFENFDHQLPKAAKGSWGKDEYSKYAIELLTHVFIGMEHILHLKEPLSEEYCQDDNNQKIWFSDPGHGLGYAWDPQESMYFYRTEIQSSLTREVRFMHIEDDPSYFWSEPFDKKLGFKTICYRHNPEDRFGDYQFYTASNVETAISRIKSKDEIPEVILTDIELPDGNGLELARKLHDLGKAFDAKPLIFVYSSFLEGFAEKLQELISEQIVVAAYPKQGFQLENLIRDINARH